MSKEKVEMVLPEGAAKGGIRDNLEVICFAILLIMFFKTFVGQQFTIPTGSMRNTLMIGDHLLVNKFIFAVPQWDWEAKLFPMRHVDRGDIIVFRFPMDRDYDYVKRCIALPGDQIEIRQKRLYIKRKGGQQMELITGEWEHHRMSDEEIGTTASGNPIYKDPPEPGPWPLSRDVGKLQNSEQAMWPFQDPFIYSRNMQDQSLVYGFRDFLRPITIPEGYIFAMGDNREDSADSRYWGFVPIEQLRGRPFMIWWSYREGGVDHESASNPSGPVDVVKNFIDGARYFFVRTRWDRSGHLPR